MIEQIKSYFGFIKMPFSKQSVNNQLFESAQIKEVFARLELAIANEDIFLLTGAVGSGKTTAAKYFINNLDPNCYKSVYISVNKFKFGEIAKHSLAELQMQVPYSTNFAIRKFKQVITNLHKEKGIKVILVVDEAQDLSIDTLIALKNIVNFDMDSQCRMLLLLCAQKEFLHLIDLEALASLKRRIRLRYEIKNLSLDETKAFIKYQLKIAGLERPLFPDDVIAQIYASSVGNISEINRICFNMINTAVSESKEVMELSMLEKAVIF
jgi:type II secretory pathway predicted ATPase ExeA